MFLSLFWKKDQSPVPKMFSKARKKNDDFYEISPTTDDCDITFLPENLQMAEKCCIFALEIFDSWFIRGQ